MSRKAAFKAKWSVQVGLWRRRRQPADGQAWGVDELLGLLSDPDPEVRLDAADKLWERADELRGPSGLGASRRWSRWQAPTRTPTSEPMRSGCC